MKFDTYIRKTYAWKRYWSLWPWPSLELTYIPFSSAPHCTVQAEIHWLLWELWCAVFWGIPKAAPLPSLSEVHTNTRGQPTAAYYYTHKWTRMPAFGDPMIICEVCGIEGYGDPAEFPELGYPVCRGE